MAARYQLWIWTPVDQALGLLAIPAILQACSVFVANQRVVFVAAVRGHHAVAGAILRQMYRAKFEFWQCAAVNICQGKCISTSSRFCEWGLHTFTAWSRVAPSAIGFALALCVAEQRVALWTVVLNLFAQCKLFAQYRCVLLRIRGAAGQRC